MSRPSTAHPTLEEVARTAGVSRATASRAVNGGARVSPKAQAAVDAAVKELGYSPNMAARTLVTRRTGSVAVVVPEPNERVFSDPFFAGTLRGVARVLAEHDQQLVLLLARTGAEGERTLRYLRGRHVDGAFITSHHRDDRLVRSVSSLQIPCVFGGRPWSDDASLSYVDVDNAAGGRLAAKALLDRGCRRVATIAGPEDMTAAQDRLEGWRSTLRAAGVDDGLVVHGDFTREGGAAAAARLLGAHPEVDGVFAASDLMAAGLLQVLGSRGCSVPDDVAVVGFDDADLAARTTPALTTLRNPVVEMAEQATRLLLHQVDSGPGRTAMRVVHPTRLVRRDTC